MDKETTYNAIFAVLATLVTFLIGEVDKAVIGLGMLMGLDVLSGLLSAWQEGLGLQGRMAGACGAQGRHHAHCDPCPLARRDR